MITEKDAVERKRKIKASAYTLFQERGVDSVTFGDIAKHSGISESSIYHYFHQKSNLMIELHQSLWLEIAAVLRARTADLPEFQAACGYRQIDWLIDAFVQLHIEHPEYLKFALECKLYWIHKKSMINHEQYIEIVAPVMQQFTAALKKGTDDHSVCLDADFDSCSFLLWGVLRSYLEQMVALDMMYADKSNFSQYFQIFKMLLLKTIKA